MDADTVHTDEAAARRDRFGRLPGRITPDEYGTARDEPRAPLSEDTFRDLYEQG